MDKASIRLEITCSQLAKNYYGKRLALTKCNFLLPSSAENPSDFFPSIGKSINYICSWTYANVASTLSKQELVPGGKRVRGELCVLQTQMKLQKPPCTSKAFTDPVQPWGEADDGVGKERTNSSKRSSYSQQGKPMITWALCSPSPTTLLPEWSLYTAREVPRGEALPSPTHTAQQYTRLPARDLSGLTVLLHRRSQ